MPQSRRSPHLLIQTVIAFCCGIGASVFHPVDLTLLFSAALLLALLVLLSWRAKNALTLPLLLSFWLVCGLLHGASGLQPPSSTRSLYHQFATGREATLAGILLQAPSVSPDKTRLLLRAEACYLPPLGKQPAWCGQEPRAAFLPAEGDIELTTMAPLPDDLQPGQRLLIRAVISRPKGFAAPGVFDYRQYLAAKSIWVTGWISSPAYITRLPEDGSHSNHALWRKWRFYPEQLRQQINRFLLTSLPGGQSGLYMAILTGDTAALTPETLENYKATGAIHLLSISGLHMALISLAAGGLINWLMRRSPWLLIHTSAGKIAVGFILPILFGYALIAGMQAPVVRSLIMTLVFLFAVLLDRQWHVPTNIAIAALLMALINPAALFSISLQLSFAAVIAMALILPRILPAPQTEADRENRRQQHLASRILLAVKGGLFLSFAALAGTLPLLLLYFNRFSPLAAISTLLLEPLLCWWALPLGLISCPLIFFAPETARILLKVGAIGLSLADRICAWLAALPGSSIWLPTPLPLEIIGYYALLGSLLYLLAAIKRQPTEIRRPFALLKTGWPGAIGAAASLIALLLTAVVFSLRQQQRPADIISMLDVGQGNASVIELAGGYTMLIDGGGPWSPQFNVGERVIAPFLWKRRISRLDTLVISHPDADHCNGLAFIIQRFRPRLIWVNGENGAKESYQGLLALASRLGIPVHVPQQGETLFANRASCIKNVADLHLRGTMSDNDKSLAIRLTSQGSHFLFTGDISALAEQKMVEEQQQLKADVLLLPHHGSISSTSALFLAAVSPAYAVISAGRRELFPAPAVLERCRKAGCTIYNTAQAGTVIFTSEKGRLRVATSL